MALASLHKTYLVATRGESFVEWCYVISFLGSLVGTKCIGFLKIGLRRGILYERENLISYLFDF